MFNKVEMGKRLKELRFRENKTLSQVTNNMAGITEQMLSSYENGLTIPSLKNFEILHNYYGVSLDYICFGTEGVVNGPIKDYSMLIKNLLNILKTGVFVDSKNIYSEEYGRQLVYFQSLDKNLCAFFKDYIKLFELKESLGDELFETSLNAIIQKYEGKSINE